jgi:tRNA (mo5U34)-methyltransferase
MTTTAPNSLAAAEVLAAHPEWYHSIELAPGIVTPGRAPLAAWEAELADLQLPDLRGKSVLDIGAYDGYFSFAAERRGASRVVALDHSTWSSDMVAYMREWRSARDVGKSLPSPHLTKHWRPDELPGRKPFDAARACLGSSVEPMVGDFMTVDAAHVGQFDVVLFLGVLYHLEDPLLAMRRVAQFVKPGGLCIVETEAMEIPGSGDRALCEFFPGAELNDDASNWWAPNAAALAGLCRAAGFSDVRVLPGRKPIVPWRRAAKAVRTAVAHIPLTSIPIRYRAISHAVR